MVELSLLELKEMDTGSRFSSVLGTVGLRKFNLIHAQLRKNCSNLNARLHSLHVIDSPACVCSHSIEGTAFFLDCALYHVQRLALRNTVSRFSHFRLETSLYDDHYYKPMLQ